MLKKCVIALSTAITLAFATTGCTTVIEVQKPAQEIKINQLEYDLGKALLTAFVTNDAEAFVNLLPEDTRNTFDKEAFAKHRASIVKSVGEPISFHYLTTVELTTLNPQIWKVRFKRTNLKNTEDFTSELLFRVVTGMSKKNEAIITSFQFL